MQRRTEENSAIVLNHVFTCSGCSRQWTINSRNLLECFFVGLCYWCIRQYGIKKDQIDECLLGLLKSPTIQEQEAKQS